MIIDTHAHLWSCTPSVEELLSKAASANVSKIVNVAINLDTAKQVLETHKRHPNTHPTIGVYPGEVQDRKKIKDIPTLAKNTPYVAIGEIGLDYYKMRAPKSIQIEMFEQQLQIAKELNLPAIIHNRHSDEDMIQCCNNFSDVKKVIHCFSSDTKFVDAIINDNTFFSFTATITYAKKGKTIDAVKYIPLSQIMIETDCPYLTPEAFQGQENQPAYVPEVAKRLAELKNISLKDLLPILYQTSQTFFNL